jgi:DNA-binding transcriptional MerR regulator
MAKRFPGTTIEVSELKAGASRTLFEGIFATGGITLSQICVMTGLEYYIVQNWVKRGFLSNPKKRVYTKEQFARIIIINMLREALQIEKISGLIKVIGGALDDKSDDLISDDELYHIYVDMIADDSIDITDRVSTRAAAERAVSEFEDKNKASKEKLLRILEVMFYAHSAAMLRERAEELLAGLDDVGGKNDKAAR